MSTRFLSIVWLENHEYEVTFETDGEKRAFRCLMKEEEGLRYFRASPDPWPGLAVQPKIVADALKAFEQVNRDA